MKLVKRLISKSLMKIDSISKEQTNDSIFNESDDDSICQSNYFTRFIDTMVAYIPLCNLFIPGTHDSGAYMLNTKLGFSIDRVDLQKNIFLRIFYFIASLIVRRFSITQDLNIYDQLMFGARYLDIRVGLRPEDNQYYIVHNLYGPRIENILTQVSTFINENLHEVVILDFQHLHGFNSIEDHFRLLSIMIEILGESKIISPTLVGNNYSLTLNKIWSINGQVIIIYRNAYQECNEFKKYCCPGSFFPNPWPNTTDPKRLVSFLNEKIAERQGVGKPLRMFILQAVLTPHTKYVLMNSFQTLRNLLATKSNKVIFQLLVDKYSFETKSVQELEKELFPNGQPIPFGPNIVMIDCMNSSTNKIVALCAGYNVQYYNLSDTMRTNLISSGCSKV